MAYALVGRSRGSGPALVRSTRPHGRASRAAGVHHARRPGGLANPRIAALKPMPVLQAKLEVGAPHDRFEQEAYRVADQVMRMADPQNIGPMDLAGEAAPDGIQRLCAECEEEVRRQPAEGEEKELQIVRAAGATAAIGPGVQMRINGMRCGGQPLTSALRGFF